MNNFEMNKKIWNVSGELLANNYKMLIFFLLLNCYVWDFKP